MDRTTNTIVIMAVEKLMESRADLMEPHFADKVLKNSVVEPFMSSTISKIILCVVANYEVTQAAFCMSDFYFFLCTCMLCILQTSISLNW